MSKRPTLHYDPHAPVDGERLQRALDIERRSQDQWSLVASALLVSFGVQCVALVLPWAGSPRSAGTTWTGTGLADAVRDASFTLAAPHLLLVATAVTVAVGLVTRSVGWLAAAAGVAALRAVAIGAVASSIGGSTRDLETLEGLGLSVAATVVTAGLAGVGVALAAMAPTPSTGRSSADRVS
ncbi:MAG: hypothetical protein AAFP84_07025 [Actinomycetota bacterium]